jgi:hypothetical protein
MAGDETISALASDCVCYSFKVREGSASFVRPCVALVALNLATALYCLFSCLHQLDVPVYSSLPRLLEM